MRPNCDPKTYTSDFESACIGAVEEIFEDAATKTCYFHLMQSFRRKIDEYGLRTRICSDKKLLFDYRKLK